MNTAEFKIAMQMLEELGFVVDVCHISALTNHYKCTKEQARDILEDVYLELEDTILDRMHDRCEHLGCKKNV